MTKKRDRPYGHKATPSPAADHKDGECAICGRPIYIPYGMFWWKHAQEFK